ncbi:MAG TPA: DUF4863 family protein [Planctomycetota bacterium]|nr:DUF4863 family protein [Planctomycetota bacterium]
MLQAFVPLLEAAHGLDLTDTVRARAELRARLDPSSPQARALGEELLRLCNEGKIANRGELPVKWGRVSKATPETLHQSIDVVLMNGAGPRHRHPAGEVNFCIAVDGAPTFEGEPPGWVVLEPGSTHVPTVRGGTMLIVYLLPRGEMEFLT